MRHMLLTLTATLAIASPVFAEDQPRTITVEAVGRVELAPEIFIMVFEAEAVAATRDEATAAMEAVATRILEEARRLEGLERLQIETRTFQINRVCAPAENGYGSNRQPCSVTHHRAMQTLSLRGSPVALAGNMASLGGDLGAYRAEITGYDLVDPEAAQRAAQREAVAEAHRRAEGIAAALGRRLGPVRNVQPVRDAYYDGVHFRSVELSDVMMDREYQSPISPAVGMTVEPGPVRVEERLTLTFDLSED